MKFSKSTSMINEHIMEYCIDYLQYCKIIVNRNDSINIMVTTVVVVERLALTFCTTYYSVKICM